MLDDPSDGGIRRDADSGDDDAGNDEDAGSGDAGVQTHCGIEGKVELCYGADPATLKLPCRAGTRVCHDGVFGECQDHVVPQAEQCNGEDDDCDGKSDEALGDSDCTLDTLKGECAIGVQLCRDGVLKCLQEHFPLSDVCDGEGKDDDCDGKIDENTDVSCYEGADGCDETAQGQYSCKGSCRAGKHVCKDGKYDETVCEGQQRPAAESCTESGQSSSDENCDGEIDEGCTCIDDAPCYTGPAGTLGVGLCKAGTKFCTDATHGSCEDEVTPRDEYCTNTGVDDDCNGEVDDIPWRGTGCAEVSDNRGVCKAGATWQCVSAELQCVDAAPGTERCDGVNDEDCDGTVDDGFLLMSDRNNCGACGRVCGAGLSCCGGRCVNVTTSNDHCSACGMACASGTTCCAGGCKNVLTDVNNCGTCGRVCGGVLLPSCTNGVCNKVLL